MLLIHVCIMSLNGSSIEISFSGVFKPPFFLSFLSVTKDGVHDKDKRTHIILLGEIY